MMYSKILQKFCATNGLSLGVVAALDMMLEDVMGGNGLDLLSAVAILFAEKGQHKLAQGVLDLCEEFCEAEPEAESEDK
jgi:hypothetical protein